ncbi:MAG: hypothetical protein ACTSXT_01330 [Candidatus Helarchaeota archaeon]
MATNTSIRGLQIKDAFFGAGLSRNGADGNIMDLDLNDLSAAVVDVANDSIAIIDANDNNASRKEAIADLIDAVAGDGLSASSGVLAVDLNELTETAIAVADDYIAFIDSDDNSSKKESVADLVTAMAGSGLTATNGVLSVDSIANNIVEGDLAFEDESATCDGVETEFTLSDTPLANSVQVFLNGLLQQEGSGKDYTIAGTTITFATAPESGDILLVYYIIDN